MAFLDAMGRDAGTEMHSLMVMKHGQLVAAGWWAPFGPQRPHLLYSLSKSFTSTALGFAVGEGLVRLDERALDCFPELDGSHVPEAVRRITVHHLASMATGHTADMWEASLELGDGDPVRGFFRCAPDREPGSVFAYNQSATYTLAAVLQRRAGTTLTQYLRPRLFDRFPPVRLGWQQQQEGVDMGFSGLFAPTVTAASLGELYLRDGRWGGRQLLPPGWAALASSPHVPTANPVDAPGGSRGPDWLQGYGYQFWLSRHGFRGDGALGQFCLVLPEADAVVAITSRSHDTQALLDAVWEHLLPALGGRPGGGMPGVGPDPEADAELAQRLARLAVPVPAAASRVQEGDGAVPGTPGAGDWCGAYRRAPRTTDQPHPLAVEVRRDGAHWLAEISDQGVRFEARFGPSRWSVSEGAVPNAALGWQLAPGRLRLRVMMLEAPHILDLDLSTEDRTFEASWSSVPLRAGTLAYLACPD
jgi:CubicO group peptidase (beta-lactamase class C family)